MGEVTPDLPILEVREALERLTERGEAEARPPERCECGCHSFAQIDVCKPGRPLRKGREFRCVDCKRVAAGNGDILALLDALATAEGKLGSSQSQPSADAQERSPDDLSFLDAWLHERHLDLTDHSDPTPPEEEAQMFYGYITIAQARKLDAHLRDLTSARASPSQPVATRHGSEAAAEPSGAWRPIETAPRDGTPILAFCVHDNARYAGEDVAEWTEIVTTRWLDFQGGGWTWHGLCGRHTHWMPLPDAPSPAASPRSLGVSQDDQ